MLPCYSNSQHTHSKREENCDGAITTIDADGVALAGVQGVYKLLKEQQHVIDLQAALIADLESRVAILERLRGQLSGQANQH